MLEMNELLQSPPMLSLLDASVRLGEATDLDELLAWIVDAALQTVGAEVGYLILSEEQGGEWHVAVAREASRANAPKVAEIHTSAVEKALAAGVSVATGFAAGMGNLNGQVEKASGLSRPIQIVPLKARGRILGALYLDTVHSAGAGKDERLRVLKGLANQAAIAIENERLRSALEAEVEAKSTFVSDMSHELRLPMTSIMGYTDLVLSKKVGPLTEMQAEFLGRVRRNVKRMNVLVDDVSYTNRVESDREPMDPSDFDIRKTLKEVDLSLLEAMTQRQQQFTVNLPSDLPNVYADRSCVGRVMAVLLENASLYTPPGGTISVTMKRANQSAEVRVSDDGIGVSEEDQVQIFYPFYRSENGDVRKQDGWGLGLTLAKRVVEKMGGEIWCESQLHKGSTFAFTVPLAS